MFASTLALVAFMNPSMTPTHSDSLKVGDLAPDFVVDRWNGGQTRLSDRHDQVAVVTFWNTSSPDSKFVINHIRDIQSKMTMDSHVVFYFVNTGDDQSTYSNWMSRFARRYHGNWGYDPMTSERSGLVRDMYSVTNPPTTYIINRMGRVHAIINGYQTGDTRYSDGLKSLGMKFR